MQTIFRINPFVVVVTMAACIVCTAVSGMSRHVIARSAEPSSPLVVRVAVFGADQGTLRDRESFINDHLFPTVRPVPGYLGTFLGRDAKTGQVASISFWRTAEDMAAGEEAVGRTIRSLPEGTAPKPSSVTRYVVEYRDVQGLLK